MDIKPIETHYNGYRFRSRLEARWAVFFDAAGVPYEYEPQGFVLADGTPYLPDFYLPYIDRWIEIKPSLVSEYPNGEWADHPAFWDISEDGADPILNFGDNTLSLVVVSGMPGLYESKWGIESAGYGGTIWSDNGYAFCECPLCGLVGIEYGGRSDRLPCKHAGRKCEGKKKGDRGHNYDSPKLLAAYKAARSARFEHGQTPTPQSVRV